MKNFFLRICSTFCHLYFVLTLIKAKRNGKVSSCIFKAEEIRLLEINRSEEKRMI